MSRAAFAVTKWAKYRNAQLYGTTMEAMIDVDLQHKNPPDSDTIVELMLLGDTQYMSAMLLSTTSVVPSSQRGMSIAAISHDPTHPFYKRIKNAFGYANSRRKKAFLSLNKWPIPIPLYTMPKFTPATLKAAVGRSERRDRRLVWSLNHREVCAARGVFKQYVRKGLVPFSVDSNGEASKRITAFDPAAEEVIFIADG